MDISVIVPVYNGEKTVEELLRQTESALGRRFTYEVIFVHDCGKDGSRAVIQKLQKENPEKVKGIYHSKNIGQHKAIIEGIASSCGDYVVTMDEDLQHDPAYIPLLKQALDDGGYDVVYARFIRQSHPGMRIWLSELLRKTLRKIIPDIYPHYSSYRIIKRDIALKLPAMNNSYAFIDGYLARMTDRFGHIDAEHLRRADGRSSYSYFRLVKHAWMIVWHFCLRSEGGWDEG